MAGGGRENKTPPPPHPAKKQQQNQGATCILTRIVPERMKHVCSNLPIFYTINCIKIVKYTCFKHRLYQSVNRKTHVCNAQSNKTACFVYIHSFCGDFPSVLTHRPEAHKQNLSFLSVGRHDNPTLMQNIQTV